MTIQTGDSVTFEYQGVTCEATVTLASSNGRSVMLGFEAIVDGHVGAMPVLMDDDGEYRSLVTGVVVKIAKK